MRNIINYFIEVKLGNRENGSPIMRTWHSHDLLNFSNWLDREYPSWRYFNVMDKDTRTRLASFTQSSRPISKQL